MFIARSEVPVWEVWVYASGDYREPVESCGLFREEQSAAHAASLVRDYLHLGAWNDNVLDNATGPEAEFALRLLPADLRAAGIDPARTHVTARRVDGTHDNAESQVAADWLAAHGWRADRGHAGGRAPVGSRRR